MLHLRKENLSLSLDLLHLLRGQLVEQRKIKLKLKTMSKGNIYNNWWELISSIGLCFEEGPVKKVGYLSNMKTTSYLDQNGSELSALLMYFIQPDG